MKIAVLGAGIVGLAAAHALADEGHVVTIIDREGPAAGTSRGNAGWIAHTDIDPIASPKMLRQVPRFLMDPLGPLAIRREYILQILPWLARLILASRPSQLERSIKAITAIQSLAMPAWDRLSEQLGIGHLIHRRGSLFVYDRPQAFQTALPHYARQKAAGIHFDLLDGGEIRQLEPGLTDAIIGGAYFPDSAHVSDPRLITEALYETARAREIGFVRGTVARIAAGNPVVLSFSDRDPMEFDKVVLSLGAWSKPLAAQLGDAIPLDTERGYNVSFPGQTMVTRRPVAFPSHGFVTTPLDTGFRVGGAVELGGLDLPPNHERTRAIHGKAKRFIRDLPDFETGTTWMGFRPSIPDSLPVIGYAKATKSVVYAFGHGHYGLTQSAATGRIVADLIAGRPTEIDLTSFKPNRF